MTDGPNRDTFKRLAGMIPGIKQKAVESIKHGKLAKKNGVIEKPPVCIICGKNFGSVQKIFTGIVQKKSYCPKCQGMLDEGYCAAVTADCKRYAFIRFPTMPKEWAGNIQIIKADTMDKIQEQQNAKS